MKNENKDQEEVADTPAEAKPKLTLIVILAILIGVLLTLVIGGTAYHFQSGKAMQAELAAIKLELKRKTLMITELQEQIAGLSQQVHALKEFSVAKASGDAKEALAVTDKSQPAANSSPPTAPVPETVKEAPAAPPVTKKTKPSGLDCQIVGKSPEEQMATLKRCTQAMDGKK